ncbi:transposase IS4 family protein [Actinoplanes sp. SE50/110]|nr:transposase IS4 family protein [Actinoplanes sp. SE50/110]SLL96993.1 transposase [Actinoplanes sp. SE50/110]
MTVGGSANIRICLRTVHPASQIRDAGTIGRAPSLEVAPSAEVISFADKAYQGVGGTVRTPFKRHRCRPELSARQKPVNQAHARIHAQASAPS